MNIQDLRTSFWKMFSTLNIMRRAIFTQFFYYRNFSSIFTYFLLISLLNRIFSSSTFPSPWKLVVTVLILEPQKNPNHPSSYRPISLLSTLSKILEKILNKRLSWYLESNNLLNQSQYGCRRGRSAIMALAELDARIHRANANGSTLYSLFFDLENAFPRV